MEIRQLTIEDAEQFSNLIVNMYSNLENLEWFSPMPYDIENVINMITNPRFYILGLFDNNFLCAVSSLDYKCGKLIGKIDFPKDCNTDKLVEFGFTMVHYNYRGHGYAKKIGEELLKKVEQDGFEWCFGKVHKNNLASVKTLLNNKFYIYCDLHKPIKKIDFINLSNTPFFSKLGKENAKKTLEKFTNCQEIIAEYYIIMKKLI